MDGAALRMQERRAEVWYGAMLPRLEKPPKLQDFVGGPRDKRAEIVECLNAWDKVDRALARRH